MFFVFQDYNELEINEKLKKIKSLFESKKKMDIKISKENNKEDMIIIKKILDLKEIL